MGIVGGSEGYTQAAKANGTSTNIPAKRCLMFIVTKESV
jgi:hypothetical protein